MYAFMPPHLSPIQNTNKLYMCGRWQLSCWSVAVYLEQTVLSFSALYFLWVCTSVHLCFASHSAQRCAELRSCCISAHNQHPLTPILYISIYITCKHRIFMILTYSYYCSCDLLLFLYLSSSACRPCPKTCRSFSWLSQNWNRPKKFIFKKHILLCESDEM